MLYTFGLAGGTRRVKNEQRMLGPLGFAGVRLFRRELVHPQIARRRKRDIAARPPVHDDVADGLASPHDECLVDDRLQRQVLAAARLLVRGHHGHRAGIDDALLQRLRGKAAEYDRMRRPDTRAGLHRDHAFDRHRHVDQHAVALADPERLEAVREPADAVVELPVGPLSGPVIEPRRYRELFRVAVVRLRSRHCRKLSRRRRTFVDGSSTRRAFS